MTDYIAIPQASSDVPSANAIALVWDRVDPSDPSTWRIIGKSLSDFGDLLSTASHDVVTAVSLSDNTLIVNSSSAAGDASSTTVQLGEPELLWDSAADALQIDGTEASRPYTAGDLFFAAGSPTTAVKSYELRRAFNPNRMLCMVSVRGQGSDLPAIPTGAYENVHRLMPGFLLERATNTHPAWETYVEPALRAGKYFSNTSNTRISASVSSSSGVHPSNPFRGALQIWEM